MTLKEMCERFKKFLIPSPLSDEVKAISVSNEVEVKKCKRCGMVLKDTEKDFCSDYCEGDYLWNEYCKKEYGVANCVICGKEFVKFYPDDEICKSYLCYAKKRIAEMENEKENTFADTALEYCDDTYDDAVMQEDIFESVDSEATTEKERLQEEKMNTEQVAQKVLDNLEKVDEQSSQFG